MSTFPVGPFRILGIQAAEYERRTGAPPKYRSLLVEFENGNTFVSIETADKKYFVTTIAGDLIAALMECGVQ